jgi:transcriptional regulator with XRE-family HTH domain
MGRRPSERPARLAEKLKAVRDGLGLSQGGMVRALGYEDKLTREDISKYERGVQTPSLLTLLAYAKAAGITVDTLIDDEVELPRKLPLSPKSKHGK